MNRVVRVSLVALTLLAMALLPRAGSSRAQGARVTARADSTDSAPAPRPVVRVRLRAPRPSGVRIHSVRDYRARVIYFPRLAVVDTGLVPVTPRMLAAASIDTAGLEARLREYLDQRLAEMEARQSASLAAIAAANAAALAQAAAPPAASGPEMPPATQQMPPDSAALASGVPTASQPSTATGPGVVVIEEKKDKGSSGESAIAGGIAGGIVGFAAGKRGPSPAPLATDSTAVVAADTLAARQDSLALAAGAHRAGVYAIPTPTVEFVERAVLDTGLLRTVSVVFEVNQARLLPPSLPVLDSLGRVLVRYPDIRLEIGGHTDNTGPAEHNRVLSQARADSVRAYLVASFAIEGTRLTAIGYGEDHPIASNHTTTGRTLNRRVEFSVFRPDTTGTRRSR